MAFQPIEFRRLKVEDFPAEDQNLIGKIGFSYNNFGDQIVSIVNGNITIDHLQREVKQIKLQVDDNGTPTVECKISLQKVKNASGMLVVRAQNLSSPGTPPLAAPFLTWSQSSSIITVTNVIGLQSYQTYTLTLEIL